MAIRYLNKTGVETLWNKIKKALSVKVDKEPGKGLSSNDFTSAEKEKLSGIEDNAQVNVRADWKATSGDAFILNKPTIPSKLTDLTNDGNFVQDSSYVHTDNNFTTEEKNKLNGIAAGAEVNVQSDWNITSNTSDAFIKNKPTLGTAAAKDVPASGNASSSQVVMGNDSRLTNSRPASDVSAWAKASTKPSYTASEVGAIPTSQKGSAGGVAELDANGLVPSSQLPSYVDDVLEYDSKSAFPAAGESGKIYIDQATNLTYRWTGSGYAEISPSIALGETSSTAYRGDRGKTAYDHATETGRIGAAKASGLYKVASTAEGHIASLTAVTKADITGLGIPASNTNTTYTLTQDSSDGHKFTLTGSDGSSTTVTIPDNDTKATLSSLGIANVKNYDQSKAIKSITRSGTTFTYTCLDNTTGTFTQQDNNTWTAMTGATSSANGAAGYVPAPPKDGYNTKYLRADGSWTVPPNTNTTYTANTTSVGSASGWSAGTVPTLGTAIAADDITAWTANTATTPSSVTASKGVVKFTSGSKGTAASLSYTARSIPNVTSVGTAPKLTVTSTTVATGITAS